MLSLSSIFFFGLLISHTKYIYFLMLHQSFLSRVVYLYQSIRIHDQKLYILLNQYYTMQTDKTKAYQKAYRESHRAEIKAYREETKAYQKAYQKENEEVLKEKHKLYYERNKEYITERNKAYNASHREEIKAYYGAYRESHIESIKEYYKTYYKDNKDMYKEYYENNRDPNTPRIGSKEYSIALSCGSQHINIEDFNGFTDKKRPHLIPPHACIQMNDWFEGSHAHHITKSIIIYIPSELHQHIKHNLRTGHNMGEINALSIQFVNGGL